MRTDRVCLVRPDQPAPLLPPTLSSGAQSDALVRDDTLSIEEHCLSGGGALHYHDCYELEIVITGRGENRIAGKSLPFERGTLTLLSPAEMHAFRASEPTSVLSIKLTDLLNIPEIEEIRTLSFPVCGHLPEKNMQSIEKHLSLLRDELSLARNDVQRRRLGANFIGWLLIDVLSCAAQTTPAGDSCADDVMLRVVEYVRANFRRALSLNETAALFGYTPGHLGVRFRRATGLSFSDYVCMQRLNYARSLLEQSDAPVQRVGELSGFESPSYFTRRFKRACGCSPAQYRQNHRSVQAHHESQP